MTLPLKKTYVFGYILAFLFSLCLSTHAAETEKPLVIVSLGDSFSSGEGVIDENGNTFFYGQDLPFEKKVQNADWVAHRSEKSWPAQLKLSETQTAADLKDQNWFFAAASGASTAHITGKQQIYIQRNDFVGTAVLAPQISVFDTEALQNNPPDYVTITLGGNDAGFTDIISVAATNFFSSTALPNSLNAVWDAFYAEGGIRDKIYNVYQEIHQKTNGKSTILVAGYPKLFAPDGDGFLYSKNDVTLINQAVSEFNVQLNAIVEQCRQEGMDIHFISVEDAFENHGAYAQDAYINPIILSLHSEDLDETATASSYSVHPNQKGAEKYAELVNAKIIELESEDAFASFLYATCSPSETSSPVQLSLPADISLGNLLISNIKKN
ncbi:MAG: SGNH/GDSL hydrolase family protein [Clostridia bacterium]|nr:SGNH/GDSL hydrolase family protein [Clostridia bacterium]